MNRKNWFASQAAPKLLLQLWEEHPEFFRSQTKQLHRFLIDCCWKHKDLIPQKGLRDGLKGAEQYLAGEIGVEELGRLNWHAEAEAFHIDYAETSEELADIKRLIASIPRVRAMPFEAAREILLRAAYFAEGAMIYPDIRHAPWNDSLFKSEFLCADVLRHRINPP